MATRFYPTEPRKGARVECLYFTNVVDFTGTYLGSPNGLPVIRRDDNGIDWEFSGYLMRTIQEPEREEWEPRKLKFGDQVSAVCWHHPLSDESLRFDGTFVKPFPNAPANYAWVLPNGNKWNEKDPSAIGCAVRACKWESLRPLSPPPVAIGDFVEGLTDGKFKQDTGVAVCGFVIGSAELNIAIGLLPADAVPFATITRESVRLIKKAPPPVGSADAATREDAEAKPSGGALWNSAQPAGGGSSKPDTYRKATIAQCAHGRIDPFGRACLACGASFLEIECNGKPRIEFVEWRDEQDKIAARRRLDQTKAELDRKLTAKHASDWDVDDSPSNVWCNGRP